jgi:succinoglycan biosynthesis protein ExoA
MDPKLTDAADVSVLVPVLNEERYIAQSVAAMQRQRFPGRIELLFVDGGSSDRTREILESLAAGDDRVRVLDNPRRTSTSGLNVALSHARGQWVVRMDAHTVYPDDYVALGVRRLQQGGTRWVSGPQLPKGHGRVSRTVALALSSPLGRGGSRKWDRRNGAEFEVDSGVFCGVWERATLLEYGGWDERWPINQDSELAGRFLGRGESIMCVPAMGAQYTPRDSLSGLWRQYRRYGEFRAKTAYHHPHTMRRSQLLAPGVVLDAIVSVAAPRPVRRAARLGLAVYGSSIIAAGVRAVCRSDNPADAELVALVPLVLVTMHFGHGTGMLMGARRHGAPLAALAAAAGLNGLARAVATKPLPVCAPSLKKGGDPQGPLPPSGVDSQQARPDEHP